MKSKKMIKKKFVEMWNLLGKDNTDFNLYYDGYISALDWLMDGKLIVNKRNKVIK